MNCKKCNAENGEETKYCSNCGTNLNKKKIITKKLIYVITLTFLSVLLITIGALLNIESDKADKNVDNLLDSDEESRDKAISEAENTIRKYFSKTSWQERAEYVLDKEKVEPLMKDYYGNNAITVSKTGYKFIGGTIENIAGDGIVCIETSFNDDAISTVYYLQKVDGKFKIDWIPSVGYDGLTLMAYKAEHPVKLITHRFYAVLSDYYNYEYSDQADNYYSIELYDKAGNCIYGYIDRESEDGKTLFDLLKDGNAHSVTLQIKYMSNTEDTSYSLVRIWRYVSGSWFDTDNYALNKYSAIFDAVKMGDTGLVETLINGGYDVNAKDENGDTPLALAIAQNNIDMVDFLMKSGANIENTNYYFKNYSHLTIGDTEALFADLIQLSSNNEYDGIGFYENMLLHALVNKQSDIVATILKYNPKFESKDSYITWNYNNYTDAYGYDDGISSLLAAGKGNILDIAIANSDLISAEAFLKYGIKPSELLQEKLSENNDFSDEIISLLNKYMVN